MARRAKELLLFWIAALAAAAAPLRAQELMPPPPQAAGPAWEGSIETLDNPPSAAAPLDPYLHDQQAITTWQPSHGYGEVWTAQCLPDGLVYRSYLAGPKESRLSSFWFHDENYGWLWDITLGGRVGVFRYGSKKSFRPEGFQVDLEGAGMPRLDLEGNEDLISADFRFGVPITFAIGIFETKLAYYHLSSHLGDEFMIDNPDFERINYSRDVAVIGLAAYLTEDVRVYGEVGYAVRHSGGAQPWEFQFGAEFSPVFPTFARGMPFAAVNAYLREEVNFGGTFSAQAGWQWRGFGSRRLFRAGMQYQVGKSTQLEFFDRNEEQLGVALWYDY